MIDRPFKPGEKVLAKVNGVETVLVFSLETSEKHDRRDHCWRYDAPYFPNVPKDFKVEPIEFVKSATPRVPDAKQFLSLQPQPEEQ